MDNGTLIYGFTVTDDMSLHRHCVDKHCLLKRKSNDGACINIKLAKYLSLQYSGCKKFKDKTQNNISDWFLLDKALASPEAPLNKKILTDFSARTASYGLRYSLHRDLGKSFVIQLLRKYRSFIDWNESLWGKGLSAELIANYENFFLKLCDDCERNSCGGIYRLYDILKGKTTIDSNNFKLEQFLALLFAFGHSNANPSYKTQSISQLVAKYEFFQAFAKEAFYFLENYIGHSVIAKANYLKSAAPFVNKLWSSYFDVSSQIFNVDNKSLTSNPYVRKVCESLISTTKPTFSDDLTAMLQLRLAFTNAITTLPYQSSMAQIPKSPVSFKSNFEATYHPFKHADATDSFFNRGKKTIFEHETITDHDIFLYTRNSIIDYLNMIKDIISTGKIVKAQPDQFSSGITLKFQKKQTFLGEECSYGVFVRSYPGGVSYLLSCF